MRHWLAATLSIACICLCAPSAFAQEQKTIDDALTVSYEGKCLDHASLSSAVAQWLGGDSVDSELSVGVQGADKPAPHARFEMRRVDEVLAVRQFQGLKGGCDDLQKALPFAIAIAIDARVVQARDASLPVPSARPDATTATLPQADLAPNVEAKQPEPLQITVVKAAATPVAQPTAHAFRLILQTQWLRAVAPENAWAAQAGLSYEVARWLDVELGALASWPDTATLAVGQAKFTLAGTIIQACARHVSAVVARACLGSAAGVVRAEGSGYLQDLSSTGTWFAGIGGADVSWPARSRLAVRVSGQILPAVRRPSYTVTDTNANEAGRLQAPTVGATVALGFSMAL